MEKDKIIAKLEHELSNGSAIDIRELCRQLGVKLYRLDRLLMEQLGVDTEQLLACYRDSVPASYLFTPGYASQPR